MRKYLLGIFALAFAITAFFAFKPVKKEFKSEKAFATAVFQYISGDPNLASSYGTVQINPTTVCPTAGSKRCAATFDVDANGNKIGNPKIPVWTKP